MTRIVTALVAVPLLLALVLAAPAWSFAFFVGLVALVGFWELSQIGASMHMAPVPGVGYLASLAYVVLFVPVQELAPSSGRPELALLGVLSVSLLASAIVSITSGPPTRERVASISFTVAGSLYVGLMLGFLLGLRYLGTDSEGRRWVVFLLLVVMMSDTGAYFTGRALGKHKLAPRVSPKKTVEGLVGGVISGAVAAAAFGSLVQTGRSQYALITLGIVLSLLGVAGDLFESSLKRAAAIKDASALIPGHGGLLDRLDSILFAAPVLWLYLSL